MHFTRLPVTILLTAALQFSAYSFAEAAKVKPLSTQQICDALLSPHTSFVNILANISDDQALLLLKSNYSELMTWLSQKSDATAEGGSASAKGSDGPNRDLTPSMLLFGEDIIEVNRTAVGFLALKWLLANDYLAFTQNQAAPVKLSIESFDTLRKYVKLTLKTPEDVDAMIVMILTNDLGKVKRYHELTEKAAGRAIIDHDELLFVGFSDWPETSPNFLRLHEKQKKWIIDGLKMGSSLNIGQFAQAENLPASLAAVKTLTGKKEAFEFKFIELLLDVAGANGHMDSNGAKVMIEPVYRNFMLARRALENIIAGRSLREAYDEILISKAEQLEKLGFRALSVENPEMRAILRLLTLRRTVSRDQAEELLEVFNELPQNAKAILIQELNIDGISDGWGILPYYAPALIDNAVRSLATVSKSSKLAIETTFLALARTLQESRIRLKGRSGNGIFTINVESLAKFVTTDAYKNDPGTLLNQNYDLDILLATPNQSTVKLTPVD